MIDFKPLTLEDKETYERFLLESGERGCEYSFSNLYLWGNHSFALLHGHIVLFGYYGKRSAYHYPLGAGDKRCVLDAIIADASERGVPCVIFGMTEEERETLETLYPGRFSISRERDSFDYVYAIDDLADLKGRKYHRKRSHYYRFRSNFPDYELQPLNEENLPQVKEMTKKWYEDKLQEAGGGNFCMEQAALNKAFANYKELGMEGLVLVDGTEVLAVTLGSQMGPDTFDVHFEKARRDVDGVYTAINMCFARHIRSKYPHIRFLNREEDMGLEGLRKSKESYFPHHMVEKSRAVI